MASLVVEISGPAADKLRFLADAEKRSESKIIGDALAVYASTKRKLPTGAGKYHSGRNDNDEIRKTCCGKLSRKGNGPDLRYERSLCDIRRRQFRASSISAVCEAESGPLLLPVILLAEIDYLLHSRLGPDAARDFVQAIQQEEFTLVGLTAQDLVRCRELTAQYRDLEIGLADATMVAAAERLQINRLLTLDYRHFRVVVPRNLPHFVLLPADGRSLANPERLASSAYTLSGRIDYAAHEQDAAVACVADQEQEGMVCRKVGIADLPPRPLPRPPSSPSR